MKKHAVVALIAIIILVSCVTVPEQTPVATIVPTTTFSLATSSLKPTVTSLATTTLKPTVKFLATSTHKPTATSEPRHIATSTPVPSVTFTQVPSVRPEYDHISGTYSLTRPDGGWCIISIILEPPNGPFSKISFELFCIRGAPSYNSGYAMDTVIMADNLAVYSPAKGCSLVFEFRKNELKITQIGLDMVCGFGHAVYADGIYILIDEKPPVLGCMRMDNPCKLTPVP